MKKSTKFGIAFGVSIVATGLIVRQVKIQARIKRKKALKKANQYFSVQGPIVTSWLFDEVAYEEGSPIFRGGIIIETADEPMTFEFTMNADSLEITGIEAIRND